MHIGNMIIGKTPFFVCLFVLIATPFVVPRLVWLTRSHLTMGIMGFEGRGTAGEQISLTYSYVYYRPGRDTIWFAASSGLPYKHGDRVPVRFEVSAVADARVDNFVGIWGDVLVYGGIPELILLIFLLHPQVVPRGSKLRLTLKSPYIRIWSTHPN